MRGTHLVEAPRLYLVGIIPAHAGNTCLLYVQHWNIWDHPRACGEHGLWRRHMWAPRGSSPRMRGTRGVIDAAHFITGIIPAHAGNTWQADTCGQLGRDHPRACGEHYDGRKSFYGKAGSSPRMRGTHALALAEGARTGIIPAHAGNTRDRLCTAGASRDHPRACGEHRTSCLVPDTNQGSSPRMRGTPDLFRALAVGEGIIPAHAGNTRLRLHRLKTPRDHPRACGEHDDAGTA